MSWQNRDRREDTIKRRIVDQGAIECPYFNPTDLRQHQSPSDERCTSVGRGSATPIDIGVARCPPKALHVVARSLHERCTVWRAARQICKAGDIARCGISWAA